MSRQAIMNGLLATMTSSRTGELEPGKIHVGERMAHWRKIKKARQRLVLCRLMIDMMRTVHGAYAPASERFGTRLETFFIALCVALGDIDGKPFSVAKIASHVRVPR